jgi:hypothetical protein
LEEVTLTPLEQKWQQEKDERGPSLDDAYDEEGRFEPAELEDVVKSRIPDTHRVADCHFALSRRGEDQGRDCSV